MNNVPASARDKRQPPTPAGQPVLRIPLAEAEEQLAERIAVGRQLPVSLIGGGNPSQVEQWRDYNRTWLDRNLGGEAAEEYKVASDHGYGYIEVEAELSKLQSIKDRLPLWATEASTVVSSSTAQASPDAPIFIVHGSDTLRAESVAHTVNTATGRKTIILRDQPNLGQTLIEKFEQHAAEVSYAIIVLTPDDHGSRAGETETRPRGRQNVIFEMGYFYGLIGRRNVSVLIRPGVEKPSDTDGIAYITFDDNLAWKAELLRELRHAGFDIQL